MIYCPKCGTANRDGSKFCNDCGARLPPPGTGALCPECGTFNPVTTLFCQKCGARVVTVSRASLAAQPPTRGAPDGGSAPRASPRRRGGGTDTRLVDRL